jgi:haloacetate dehalogenase
MFEGFTEFDIETGDTLIHGVRGGNGPALLLLHGFPQTHFMWHLVAARLAKHFTVIAADLRGYGKSGTPPSEQNHYAYCKRVMGNDMISLMKRLGYEKFAVVGHDRGGRCAYRMAIDHPHSIMQMAVLDIIPTNEVLNRANLDFALNFWPWSMLSQPYPFPERLIAGDPQLITHYPLDTWSNDPNCFSKEARAAYELQFRSSEHVHAICEEYRASITLDYEHDEQDKDKQKIKCPVLVLWGKHSAIEKWYDPIKIWNGWAKNVTGQSLNCGHFLPEEAPLETGDQLLRFLLAKSLKFEV